VPLGTAVTVEFLGPLVLALVQTRRALDAVWALLAGCGVALLGLDNSGAAPIGGLVLALAAGLCWAAYILLSARLGRVVPGTSGLVVALAAGTLLVLPFGAGEVTGVRDRPEVLIGCVAVALLSSVIPYGLEINALRRLPTRVFGILMSFEPAAAALAGLLLLGQRLGPRAMVALVLVSLASLAVTLGRKEPSPAETSPPPSPDGNTQAAPRNAEQRV
jgi:inner membrane transporter RhtA